MSVTIYNGFKYAQFTNSVNLLADTIRVMLVNGYTPSAAHVYRNEVTADEATGTGYTDGGKAARIAPPLITMVPIKWPFSTNGSASSSASSSAHPPAM